MHLRLVKCLFTIELRNTRLWLFLLLLIAFNSVFGQNSKITLDLIEVPLIEVFDEIRKNSEYKILFMNSEVDVERKVSVKVKDVFIEDVLKLLFEKSNIYYNVVGWQIVLKIRDEGSSGSLSNEIQLEEEFGIEISGKVVDSQGLPISNVNVLVLPSRVGNTTDFDGIFTIRVKKGSKMVFSYIGMKSIELIFDGKELPFIVMEEDVNSVDEVVITALGIERSKRALAYSITRLDGDEFTKARETNVANSLAGKAAGVNVTNTVTGPAGTARVIIRGNTSLTGNNQPLYVVDGVPIDNTNQGSAGMWGGSDGGDGIGNLNPDDIESMSILKGNTSAALYGSRASNGVIIITTKMGNTDSEMQVEVNSNFSFEKAINLLDPQTEYGHGINGRKPSGFEEALAAGEYSWGEKLDGSSVLQFDGVSRPYEYSGDNFDKFYQTGKTITNTVSVYGGSNSVGYRFSASRLRNESVQPNSGLNRNNFNIHLNGKGLNDRLTFNTSAQYIIQNVKNHPALADSPNNSNYTVWQLPVTTNISDLIGNPEKPGADVDTNNEFAPSSSIWFQNPYWATYQQTRQYKKNRLLGSVFMDYKINSWMYTSIRLGIDQWHRLSGDINPTGTGFAPEGSISESQRSHTETNVDFIVGSKSKLTDELGYHVLVGANKMSVKNKTTTAKASNFALPYFHVLSNGISNSGGSDEYKFGTNSLYGQLELSYETWLFLTVSGRGDWFSTLNGRSIFYPSIGTSVILSEILSLPKVFEDFGLRVSWAEVGGSTDPYGLNQSYELGAAQQGIAQGGISGDVVANANLIPLTVEEFEIGINTQLLKNRVGVDLVYYNRKTKNDILEAKISQSSGYHFSRVNVGEVHNEGVEFLIHGVPIKTTNFSWDASFNMSYNKSEVVSLLNRYVDNETIDVDRSRALIAWVQQIEGLPYGQVAGFKYLRDSNGKIALNEAGYPIQDEALGIVPFGTGVHPFVAGIQNTFQYKNLGLSFLIDMKFGAVIHSGTNAQFYRRGIHKETLKGRENGLGVIPADQVSLYYDHVQNKITEQFIYDADFVKFRELILNFDVPDKFLEGKFISEASLSFVGRNLWTIHSLTENFDPESTYNAGNAQGLEYLSLPQTKSFGFNLNMKF